MYIYITVHDPNPLGSTDIVLADYAIMMMMTVLMVLNITESWLLAAGSCTALVFRKLLKY